MLLKDNLEFYRANLSCYFCGDSIAHINSEGNIKMIYSSDSRLDVPEPTKKSVLAKLSVLKALDPQRYVIKFNVMSIGFLKDGEKTISKEVWDYMLENYDFIILKRRNILDQLLSRGLVVCTNLWHNYTDIDSSEWPVAYRDRAFHKEAYERTYTYPWEEFRSMCWLIQEHDRVTSIIPEEKRTTIYYEDLEEELIARSEELGYNPMAYPKDKLELFENKEEILEWYGKWEEKRFF